MDHLLETKEEYKNLKKQEIQDTYYQSKLDKACFQHDMAYGYSKYLPRRASSDKILRDKVFDIAKNPQYDELMNNKEVLLQWFINVLIKKLQVILVR